MYYQVAVILCAVSFANAGSGSSYTAVSRPYSDSYKYGIDHDYYGHWYGESHPHGAGGLGEGHGKYLLGGGHSVGLVPLGGYGAGYGYATSYQNHNQHHKSDGYDHRELKPVVGGLYAHYGYDDDHGYHGATSYQNQNSYSYGHHGYEGYDYEGLGYGDYKGYYGDY